jgi:hypothetical protein
MGTGGKRSRRDLLLHSRVEVTQRAPRMDARDLILAATPVTLSLQ